MREVFSIFRKCLITLVVFSIIVIRGYFIFIVFLLVWEGLIIGRLLSFYFFFSRDIVGILC